jgi:hypothetical protein
MYSFDFQDVFDKVATHLLKQGRRSLSHDTFGCVYRGKEGTKCAVGVLIDDEHYRSELERRDVSDTKVLCAVGNSMGVSLMDMTPLHISFLQALQECHDFVTDSHFEQEIKFKLRNVAANYELSPSVLDT